MGIRVRSDMQNFGGKERLCPGGNAPVPEPEIMDPGLGGQSHKFES